MDNEFDNEFMDNDFEGSNSEEISYVLGEDTDTDFDLYSDYYEEI